MNDNNEDVLFAHLLALAEDMLEEMAKTMRKFRAHLDSQDSRADILEHRIALLEQSRAKRLDAIEQRITDAQDDQAGWHEITRRILHVLDDHDTRAASLAQRCETRITALEQRLAALEEPGDPDDVRDALRALDELTTKLDGFPPQDNVICWPPFDPDQPDQTLFMWRVADDEDGE